jgi:hypothetical protein
LPAFTSLGDMNIGATPVALSKTGAIDPCATLVDPMEFYGPGRGVRPAAHGAAAWALVLAAAGADAAGGNAAIRVRRLFW